MTSPLTPWRGFPWLVEPDAPRAPTDLVAMRAPLTCALLISTSALCAGPALAGGCTSGCPTPAPAPTCPSCNLPQTHQIYVPGVTVTPPDIIVRPPSVIGGVGGYGGVSGGVDVGIDVSTSASASSSSSSSAYGAALASTLGYAASTANSQAANLLAATTSASGGGGSGSFSEGGSSANIPSLIVETPGAVAAKRICVEEKAVFRAVAIQAVCLDDKAVPHPASQTFPDRDVVDGFEGELYRCIAGSHMQYVMAEWRGQAQFDHGQTVVCEKNQSLWRGPAGRLQCRPQTPARDCNERSLLRRFGAGLKVVKASAAQQCVRWSDETVVAQTTTAGQSFTLDGGVGP